jgi:hypothetical protein
MLNPVIQYGMLISMQVSWALGIGGGNGYPSFFARPLRQLYSMDSAAQLFGMVEGVRQGDPFSPMLFILAMDPLQHLLDLATKHGILSPLPPSAARWRISMYVDDAAIFTNPSKDDLEALKEILQIFRSSSGLHVNLQKSSIHPIRCDEVDLEQVLSSFSRVRSTFPCRYLGLQLHTRTLQMVHVQPIIKRIGQRLPD